MKNSTAKKENKKKFSCKQILAICLFVTAFLSCAFLYGLTTSTFSKYVTNIESSLSARTLAFYFESDKLSESGSSYTVSTFNPVSELTIDGDVAIYDDISNVPSGHSYIQFTIKNYSNQFEINEVATDFEIKVQVGDTVETLSAELENASIIASEQTDLTYYLVISENCFSDSDSVSVEISATATSPYSKTLSATYKIGKSTLESVTVSLASDTANTNNIEMTIQTDETGGELFISLPNSLLPDPTSSVYIEKQTEGETVTTYKIVVQAYGVYELNLLKLNPEYIYYMQTDTSGSVDSYIFTWYDTSGTTIGTTA